MEKCANCNRTIGKLETPCILDDHVLCEECYARLSARKGRPAVTVSATEPTPILLSNQCPHCGYVGVVPQRGIVGSEVVVFVLFLFLFFIPAIAYYAIKDGKLYCPNCRRRV